MKELRDQKEHQSRALFTNPPPPSPPGELTVMNSGVVQKYAATEDVNEMNGRVNPALTLSDSDDEDAPPRAAHKTRKRTISQSGSGGGAARGSVSSGAATGGLAREGSMTSANRANIITANGAKEGKIGQTSL